MSKQRLYSFHVYFLFFQDIYCLPLKSVSLAITTETKTESMYRNHTNPVSTFVRPCVSFQLYAIVLLVCCLSICLLTDDGLCQLPILKMILAFYIIQYLCFKYWASGYLMKKNNDDSLDNSSVIIIVDVCIYTLSCLFLSTDMF